MNDDLDSRFLPGCRRFAGMAGSLALLLGLLVLVGGWGLDIAPLRSLLPGWETMKPATALGLAGTGAALAVRTSPSLGHPYGVRALALIPLLVGTLSLAVYLSDGLQQLAGALHFRLPSPTSSGGLFLLGAALLTLTAPPSWQRGVQWLALSAFAIAYLGLLGYLFDVAALYQVPAYATMALHTALLLLLLAMGVLAAEPDRGVMRILAGAGPGGQIARQLLPVMLVAPPLLGKLIITGAAAGLYSLTLAVGLLAGVSVAIFTPLILLQARAREALYRDHQAILEALRRSNARLDAQVAERTALLSGIINGSEDLIAALDTESRYVTFNRAYRRAFKVLFDVVPRGGRRLEEVLSQRPEARDHARHWKPALAGKAFVTTETLGDTGKIQRTYEVAYNPLKNPKGELFGAAHIARDISERIAAAEKERRARQEIEILYNRSPCGYHSLDSNGLVINMNDTELDWLGYQREEMIGRVHYRDLLAPASQAVFDHHFPKFKREGRLQGLELELQGRRERPLQVLLSAVAEKDARGDYLYSRSTLFDITELRVAERKFADLLEAVPDAIVISDLDSRILLVNRAAEQLFGYSREELLQLSVYQLIPERYQDDHAHQRDASLSGTPRDDAEPRWKLCARRKDGGEFPASVSLGTLETASGRLVIKTLRDISDQQHYEHKINRLNQDLERQNRELSAVNRELEAFSYSVSHDLRAPLRSLDGFSQALQEDYREQLDDTARDYLDRIRRGAHKMGEIIDDLLKLSRINRDLLKPQPVNLSEMARQVMSDLREGNPKHQVEVKIEADLTAEGDVQLLRTALSNLLGNAWKFTAGRDPGRIEFGRQPGAGEDVYYIRDNGVGFDMRYRDKLFSAFQRLHDSSDFPGTGIGLATVQRVIHRHGGRIWAQSSPGEGATFFFTLPRQAIKGAEAGQTQP